VALNSYRQNLKTLIGALNEMQHMYPVAGMSHLSGDGECLNSLVMHLCRSVFEIY
jgi:hypothetical protein